MITGECRGWGVHAGGIEIERLFDLRREGLELFLMWFWFWFWLVVVEERSAILWVIEVPEPGAEERIASVQQLF